jgi:hypothetical protein
MLAGGHAADRAADHDLAQRHRLGIGGRIAHAPAHIRIQREIDGAQQDLPGPDLRHGLGLQAEVGFQGLALGAAGEHDAAIDGSGLQGHARPPWRYPFPFTPGLRRRTKPGPLLINFFIN